MLPCRPLLLAVLRRPALHFSQPFDIIETVIMPNRNPAARLRLVWFILTILLAAFVRPFDGAHGNYSFVREAMIDFTVAVPSATQVPPVSECR